MVTVKRSLVLIGVGLLVSLAGTQTASCTENGVTDSTIVLGQSTSLEGPIAALGQGIQAGMNACFKRINAQGGVKNRKIVLKSLNDSYDPAKTKANVETLIHQNQVFALIQTMGTPNTEAILPLLQAERVPLLAPFSGANSLREPFHKYVVHIRGSYAQEMERITQDIVDNKKIKRVACFYQDDSFGLDGSQGLKQSLAKRDLQLIGLGTYPRNTVDVEKGFNLIADGKPDAIVVVAPYQPASAFIKKAREDSRTKDALMYFPSVVGTHVLMEMLGATGHGFITQVMPDFNDTKIPVIAEYQADMRQAGLEAQINYLSLEGYLSARLFCEVMSRMEGEPTREKFIATLENVGSFNLGGIPLHYSATDHKGMPGVFLTEFKDGKITYLTQ